jgi:hypothetical protein
MSAGKTPGTRGNAGIAVNGCPEFLGFVPGVSRAIPAFTALLLH